MNFTILYQSARTHRFGRLFSALVVLFALLATPMVLAQDLSVEQQQKLQAIQSGLKKTTINLQLAQDTAGPGTAVPAGSKAKLARMRLDSAMADLPLLQQWLAELPAGQVDVQAVATEMNTIEQSGAALDARLSGQAAAPVASQAATSPSAVSAAPVVVAAPVASQAAISPSAVSAAPANAPVTPTAVKLGYQQEDLLKGARFNLREVEGFAGALSQLVAELQPVQDRMSIDYRKVRTGLNTVTEARRKAGFVQDSLVQLPPNGQGVSETAGQLAAANAQVDAAEIYLQPLNQELSVLIDPANYPQLQQDIKRLSELTGMYSNPLLLETDRLQAAAVLVEAPAARQEVVRIATEYRRLMEQQTEEGKRIENSGNYFLEKQGLFLAAAESEKQALPGQIRSDLAEANKIANEAVSEQKPLFFTGGVPQTMAYAEDKLALYKVLDPSGAPAMEKEVQTMQASLVEREKSLGTLIIQQNPLPPDRYTGGDRDKIVAVAVDAWKHQQAEFTLLASRIPSEAWTRETMWQYSNGTWYYVDRSKLQAQLIVADEADKNKAIIRPVNIWMNHQKGDTLIGTPLHSGDDELQPRDYLLRDKIK